MPQLTAILRSSVQKCGGYSCLLDKKKCGIVVNANEKSIFVNRTRIWPFIGMKATVSQSQPFVPRRVGKRVTYMWLGWLGIRNEDSRPGRFQAEFLRGSSLAVTSELDRFAKQAE